MISTEWYEGNVRMSSITFRNCSTINLSILPTFRSTCLFLSPTSLSILTSLRMLKGGDRESEGGGGRQVN